MSINNSYFSRNNTLISGSITNTGRNPVMELFYGNGSIVDPIGFSRFIFNLDLNLLKEKYSDGTIPPINCNPNMVHTLRMTNTSFFDKELLNTSTSSGRLRATSFDLILFRIPYRDLDPDQPQYWDEGVGYDFADLMTQVPNDKNYSTRSSNWYTSSGMTNWEQAGIYSNTNSGVFTFNDLYIVDTQHFEFGDENIEFNMTSEINDILQGFLTNVAGWGIAYMPQVELLSGTTGTYEVGFFTRHTQTFYEPFLELNSSLYTSIDVLRSEIEDFCKFTPMMESESQ